ncbi:MAG: hypothetical protein ACK480_00410, partial [Planctomycetota bacterium]
MIHHTLEGVFVACDRSAKDRVLKWFECLGIEPLVESQACEHAGQHGWRFCLSKEAFTNWTPNYNTLMLSERLCSFFGKSASELIDQETVLAMLASPLCFAYPSLEEFESSARIRVNIAQAASKTF